MLIPVIRELSRSSLWEARVLAATTAGPEMERHGITAYGYRHLVATSGDKDALDLGRQLAKSAHNPASGIALEESVAYLGLCYRDLEERLGAKRAGELYATYGRHAFLPFGPLTRAVDRFEPDVVVTTNSPKSERAALLVAHAKGIPAVYLEDLFCLHVHPPFVPAPIAERVCVGSTIAAENFAGRYPGLAPAIRLTGNPAFDRLAELPPNARIEVRHRLGVSPAERLVVYMDPACTPPRLVEAIAGATGRVANTRFFVRRHPNFRIIPEGEYRATLGSSTGIAESVDLDGLLLACDLVITVASTTAVEAALVGRPVLQLGEGTDVPHAVGDRAEQLPLFEHGVSMLANSFDEITVALREALDGRTGDALRRRAYEVFVPPGRAAAAVASQVQSIARINA